MVTGKLDIFLLLRFHVAGCHRYVPGKGCADERANQMWLLILLMLAVVFIIVSTTRLNLHPFLALLIAAFGYGMLCGKMSLEEVVQSVNAGFGSTIGYIGIVILAGAEN